MVEAVDVSLIYHDHEREVYACREINLKIEKGEFIGILGPSGSGKSSLLYLLSGLKNPTLGDIKFSGVKMSSLNDTERANMRLQKFGFVFQQPYLLGYLSAIENVLTVNSRLEERAKSLLEDLGLKDKMNRFPHELSGGERQRVCVARALVNSPEVIFADEPTAALDHINGELVVDMLNRHRNQGSLVMVTHDPVMIKDSDRTLVISDGSIARN
jgi:putative ABC transport system ATP-binding protein